MKSFFHHCGSYTMNIQSGGFCISTRLKRCSLSQRTPLKIGARLFFCNRVAGLYSLQVLLLDILSGDLFSSNTARLRHNWDLLKSTQMLYPATSDEFGVKTKPQLWLIHFKTGVIGFDSNTLRWEDNPNQKSQNGKNNYLQNHKTVILR